VNDIELAVLQALKGRYGKGHAISRDQLRLDVGYMMDLPADQEVGDRIIRHAIETLRQTHPTGARIMSSSGWQGYWLLEDVSEFEAFFQEERTAAISRMGRLRKQRDLLRQEWHAADLEPQLRMFA
jgi:hypothetical protein